MIRVFWIISLLLSVMVYSGYAADVADSFKDDEKKSTDQPITVGIYVDYVSNIDINEKSVNIIFWIWFKTSLHTGPVELNEFDITNAEKTEVLDTKTNRGEDGTVWRAYKLKSLLYQNWHLKQYPFHLSPIVINIQDYYLDSKHPRYDPDIKHSKVNPEMPMEGWSFSQPKWSIDEGYFENDFGIPDVEKKLGLYYSKASYAIHLSNNNVRTYIKMFALLYLATFIILCISFLPITELRSRVGLSSAALFAVVGNILTTNELLPSTETLTIIDRVQVTFLLFMGFTLMTMLLNYYIYEKSKWCGWAINLFLGILSVTMGVTLHYYLATF